MEISEGQKREKRKILSKQKERVRKRYDFSADFIWGHISGRQRDFQLALYRMRKKNNREKDSRLTVRDKPCRFCQATSVPSDILSVNLRKKYYEPQIQTYHFRATSNILYDPYSLENIQLTEMRKEMQDNESLRHYYTFNETTQLIRGVIIRRVEKDFYGWVDFQPPHFLITNTYYLKRKQLVQNSRKMQKYLKSTSDLQSTGSGDDRHVREYIRERIKKHLDQQRIVKPNYETNSTIDMKKLTKNIEMMVEKIADLSAIHPLPSSHKKKVHTQPAEPMEPFRLSTKEISVIRKNEEFYQIREPGNYQQTYGLDTIKPKASKAKKVHKLGLRSMDKLGVPDEMRLPPETPSPKMIHRLDYTQHQDIHKREKSRSNRMVPLSPCSHSSSVSSQKSKTRKKSRSRRR